MPSQTASRSAILRQAASQALLAPSVHNTQPWRFDLVADALEIRRDRSRRLDVLDPTGRQLLISCGCAIFNARVSLAHDGYDAIVARFPDPAQADLVARIALPKERRDWVPIAVYDEHIIRRQTNRRQFSDEPVPASVLYELRTAVTEERALIVEVSRPDDRLIVARLSQEADRLENADPAYRAELRRWTSDDPRRPDGVPAMVVPHVTGGAQDDIPIRDFDTQGIGWLPSETRSNVEQCLLILGTVNDDPTSWVQAGEAMEHLWLQATRADYVASLFTQVIEVPSTRERLRSELNLMMHPHALIRVGRAPKTSSTRRRPLEDVLAEEQLSS